MTIFVPVLLLTILTVIILLLRCAFLLVMRRSSDAVKTGIALGAILVVYAVALVGAGLVSKTKELPLGGDKCFDDWCVRVNDSALRAGVLTIHLDAFNRGRRAQAPDSPRAFVLEDDRLIPIDVPGLKDRIDGGSTHSIEVKVEVPTGVRSMAFLVTEGGGPSMLVIDDENSPFHAKSMWGLFKEHN